MTPEFPEWRISAQYGAAARWISHLIDHLGNPTHQLADPPGFPRLPQRPEFRVIEFGPRIDRPYWSYVTSGLSFVPQAADGPMNYIELVAYTPDRDPRPALLLWLLAYDIAANSAAGPAYKAWDLWRCPTLGFRDFLLAVARETDDLLDFPNVNRRKDDERYLLAATGEMDREMFLDLLELIPLTAAQWQLATEAGVGTLLETLGGAARPKALAW